MGREVQSPPWAPFIIISSLAIAGFAFYYFGLRARDPIIRKTVALKNLARQIEQLAGRDFPLICVDAPATLQIYLNTWHAPVSADRAAELLRGPDPAFVAINNLAKLDAARKPGDPPIYFLLPTPANQSSSPAKIVSNRPVFPSHPNPDGK